MAREIQGKRILLRSLRLSDADDVYANVRDIAIVRNMLLPHPYKKHHATDFIKRMKRIERRKFPGEYHFAIVEQTSNKLIGMVGIFRIDYTHRNAEIGYWLGKTYRGRGIMPEAVKLLVRFCFQELKLMRVYGVTMLQNESSQNVLTKCGFRFEGTRRKSHFRRGRYYDTHLYGIVKNDWRSGRISNRNNVRTKS